MCVKFSTAYYFYCGSCNKKFINVVFENGDIWLTNKPTYAIYCGVTFSSRCDKCENYLVYGKVNIAKVVLCA